MFDKQWVKIIINNSDAFAYLLSVLCAFKPKDEIDEFVSTKSGWYVIESKSGAKPVKVKTQMSYPEFMMMIFGTGLPDLKVKVFCENDAFVLV